MREVIVFYSWQSDRPARVNRNFIERALETAVKQVNADASLDVRLVVDRDTRGVSGTPPVSQTILEKIKKCDIFLPDLTYVAIVEDGDKAGMPIPNPNVMTEYGYALSVKSHQYMMPVMNIAYGGPDNLPFDLKHLRHPIKYKAREDASDNDRQRERAQLASELESALKLTIRALPAALQPPPLVAAEVRSKAKEWRTAAVQRIGHAPPVPMLSGARLGLHLIPASAFGDGRRAKLSEINQQNNNLVPCNFRDRRPDFDVVVRPDTDCWLVYDPRSTRLHRGATHPEMKTGSRWWSYVFLNGIIEIVTLIDPLGEPEDTGPVEFRGSEIEREIIDTLDRAALVYDAIGMGGPAIVMVTLFDVLNARLIRAHGGYSQGFQRSVVELPDLEIDGVAPPLGRKLLPLINDLWHAAGWVSGTSSYTDGEWHGYSTTHTGAAR